MSVGRKATRRNDAAGCNKSPRMEQGLPFPDNPARKPTRLTSCREARSARRAALREARQRADQQRSIERQHRSRRRRSSAPATSGLAGRGRVADQR